MGNVKFTTIDGNDLIINFEEIYSLEERKDEVSTVTKFQAPELMTALEKGYSVVARNFANVLRESTRAEEAAKYRKAKILLEVVPEYENAHGKLTAPQREALVTVDTEYQRLSEIFNALDNLKTYLKTKMEGFQMSFSAVKRVYDSLSQYGMDTQKEQLSYNKSAGAAIGKPRY